MQKSLRLDFAILFACAVTLAGCGGGPAQPTFDLVPARGTVSLDGKPLGDADVTLVFQGAAPKGFAGSGGRTDGNGKLEVKTGAKSGTVVGQYKVLVSKLTMPDGSPVKAGGEGIDVEQLRISGQLKEAVPERYTTLDFSDLSVNITKDGKNEFDLKLSGS
jgi:hypothetical protein